MVSSKQKTLSATSIPERIELTEVQGWLPQRKPDAHKGSNGSALIIGGELSMAGACCLAGWSAYIAGAGLVRVACHEKNASVVTIWCPEILATGIRQARQLKLLFQQSDVYALGPGLGQSHWSRSLFEYSLEHCRPDIIDADGLTLLAASPEKRENWILTPHPGEAGRLLQCHARDVQSDRQAAAAAIASQYGGICVLKGKNTLIAMQDGEVRECSYGNAALSVAGTGDVLTGFLAGLLAQGMDSARAAICAVVLHACAAERHSAKSGLIGMLASDLMMPLRDLRNESKN